MEEKVEKEEETNKQVEDLEDEVETERNRGVKPARD